MLSELRQHYLVILALLLFLGAVAFFTYERLSPGGMFAELQNDLRNIDPEEGTVYKDLEGNPMDLDMYRGKPLIINSWATWMPFSAGELVLLERLKDEYGERVEILAMNRTEDSVLIRAYLSTLPLQGTLTLLRDPSDHFYRAIGGYAMPETVFYRIDGTIQLHKRGVLTEEELRSAIEELLQ